MPEAAWTALAAVLLWCAPAAGQTDHPSGGARLDADRPGRSRETQSRSLESLRQRSAADRWESLKSRENLSGWETAADPVQGTGGNPFAGETKSGPARIEEAGGAEGAVPDASAFEPPIPTNSSADPEQNPFEKAGAEPRQSYPRSRFQRPVIRTAPPSRTGKLVDEYLHQPGHRPVRTAQAGQAAQPRPQDRPPRAYEITPLQQITDITPFADYTPPGYEPEEDGRIPEIQRLSDEAFRERQFDEVLFTWEATNLSYNPLYFEDAPLERYGHTYHPLLQPFVSTARFGVQLVGLPYQMTIDPITKRRYTLGYYRPGEYAPKKFYQIPFNLDAAVVEAGTLTGMFFLIP